MLANAQSIRAFAAGETVDCTNSLKVLVDGCPRALQTGDANRTESSFAFKVLSAAAAQVPRVTHGSADSYKNLPRGDSRVVGFEETVDVPCRRLGSAGRALSREGVT